MDRHNEIHRTKMLAKLGLSGQPGLTTHDLLAAVSAIFLFSEGGMVTPRSGPPRLPLARSMNRTRIQRDLKCRTCVIYSVRPA